MTNGTPERSERDKEVAKVVHGVVYCHMDIAGIKLGPRPIVEYEYLKQKAYEINVRLKEFFDANAGKKEGQ